MPSGTKEARVRTQRDTTLQSATPLSTNKLSIEGDQRLRRTSRASLLTSGGDVAPFVSRSQSAFWHRKFRKLGHATRIEAS